MLTRITAIQRLRTLPVRLEVKHDSVTNKAVIEAFVSLGLKEAKDLVEEIMLIEPVQVTIDKETIADLNRQLDFAKEDFEFMKKKYEVLRDSLYNALNK